MQRWGLLLRLQRGDEGGGIKGFFSRWGGIGTDERLARPRMTETVISTFWCPTIGPLFGLFRKAGTNGIHYDIVPFFIQGFRSPNSMIKESTMPADA